MSIDKKIYFASDFHLGTDGKKSSLEREKTIVAWLESIHDNIEELYLVGDIFDYWFEYRSVVPRGYVRLLGKLAELSDDGIPIHIFTGNHDMWMFGYLEKEIGATIYKKPIERLIHGKKFYIGHGDGLGPGDHGYKFIKKVFSNRLCQMAFSVMHPNMGLALMKLFSKQSRELGSELDSFMGLEKEYLALFVEKYSKKNDIDYFVFGHRHVPLEFHLSNKKSVYYNLGDWVNHQTFLSFDGSKIQLEAYDAENHATKIVNY